MRNSSISNQRSLKRFSSIKKASKTIFLIFTTIILLGVLFEVFYQIRLKPAAYGKTYLEDLSAYLNQPELLKNIFFTTYRTILGFIIAAILGVVFGIIAGKNRKVDKTTQPSIDFLRALPSTAIIPIAALLIYNYSHLFIIVFGSLWPILINTIQGVKYVDKTTNNVIKQLHLPPIKRMMIFTLPEAFPEIVTGMKVSFAISLILAITVEFIIPAGSGFYGLGKLLTNLSSSFEYRFMNFTVIIIGILGLILNYIFASIERVIPWYKNQYHIQDTIS